MDESDARDLELLRHLASLPGFERWENQPLPKNVERWLRELDEQMLLSVTARAVALLLDRRDTP